MSLGIELVGHASSVLGWTRGVPRRMHILYAAMLEEKEEYETRRDKMT
jgi:hypothetical protein